jgi:hypothetical protein
VKLDIAQAFGVFLPYPQIEATDFRDTTPVLDTAYEQWKGAKDDTCNF